MHVIRALVRAFALPNDPELMQAQAQAFTRQVPLLYSILIINAVGLAISHAGAAPLLLSTGIPGGLCLLCLIRLFTWVRTPPSQITPEKAKRLLTVTLITSGPLGLAFALWSLSLLPYGDAHHQAHVAFFIAVTTIGCVCSLMHLRGAALLVAAAVMCPFLAVFTGLGHPVFVSMALNTVLVMIALWFVLGVNYRDFSELVSSKRNLLKEQEEIAHLSFINAELADTDPLTGIPNRRRFFRELESNLARVTEGEGLLLVGRIDLDGFKAVNDVFGHAVGDMVLVQASDRIRRVIGEEALVARLGGDEFGILLSSGARGVNLEALGSSLSASMKVPFKVPTATIAISGSIGFALSRGEDASSDLHDRADHAAYVAKQFHKGRHVIFALEHELEIKRARAVERALASCNYDEEISLAFQPIFDLAGQTVSGYEVLARWNTQALGSVPPAEFIPAAERSGTITEITCSVLRRVLITARDLPPGVRFSVNLSASDISSETSIRRIRQVLESDRAAASKIDFEITETALLRDLRQAKAAIASLSELGAQFALDDFGVGYSSLTSIKELHINRLKLDRSFVAEVSTDEKSQAIVRATIGLCHDLEMECVVEGIETVEQMQALHLIGARLMQGYFFGRATSWQSICAGHVPATRLEDTRRWSA